MGDYVVRVIWKLLPVRYGDPKLTSWLQITTGVLRSNALRTWLLGEERDSWYRPFHFECRLISETFTTMVIAAWRSQFKVKNVLLLLLGNRYTCFINWNNYLSTKTSQLRYLWRLYRSFEGHIIAFLSLSKYWFFKKKKKKRKKKKKKCTYVLFSYEWVDVFSRNMMIYVVDTTCSTAMFLSYAFRSADHWNDRATKCNATHLQSLTRIKWNEKQATEVSKRSASARTAELPQSKHLPNRRR